MDLIRHPHSPQDGIATLRIEMNRKPGGHLGVSYRLAGSTQAIRWPGEGRSGYGPWHRADDLWKHTCFELFARPAGSTAYVEINFATGDRWAAYAFYNRRVGMRTADDVELIAANWRITPLRADLHALLRAPVAYENSDWDLNATAVIELRDGTKSYWALRHPPGPPDFHHPDCFALELPPPSAA